MGRFLLPFNSGYDRMNFCLGRGGRFFGSVREALTKGFYYPPYHQSFLAVLYKMKKRSPAEEPIT